MGGPSNLPERAIGVLPKLWLSAAFLHGCSEGLATELRTGTGESPDACVFPSSTEYHTQYYEFTGVGSCWDVIHLHRLLWASVVLNVITLFLGIVTAAILGAYKDMVGPKKKGWKRIEAKDSKAKTLNKLFYNYPPRHKHNLTDKILNICLLNPTLRCNQQQDVCSLFNLLCLLLSETSY